MLTNAKVNVTGRLKIVLTDKDGNIIFEQEGPNAVVSAGDAFITSRMTGTASAVMSHMAIGTSGAAVASGQTALQGTELARVALASTTPSGNQITYAATFGAGVGTGTIAEAGIFNAASVGTMLARSISISLTKGATDTLAITWTITVN